MAFSVNRIDHVVLNCRDPDGNLIEVASYSTSD